MSLIPSFIRGQFIEVIEWIDDSRDTLVWRFMEASQHEIKNGAQLTVREGQVAQFVSEGQYADLFGPGRHTLATQNIPILTSLKSWRYAFESPFKADVYFLTTRLFTGNRWGTSNPVALRDADFGIVRVRAFGTYDFHITNPAVFLKEVAGTDPIFRLEEFADTMRSRLVSVFSEALAKAKVPVLDVATRYGELGDALLGPINTFISERYGLALTTFVVENVSVPPEVEAAIDKRSGMGAVGNLNDFVKYQLAQGLEQGGGGVAGAAAQAGVGLGLARDLAASMASAPPPLPPGYAAAPPPPLPVTAAVPPPVPTAAAPAGALDLLSPAQAAQALGVTEADVMSSLEAGDLKGKKIGATWRITRRALEEFIGG